MAQYLKDEVKTRIHEAALDVFSQRGYKGARLSDIAATADISTGNIYRYYKNKDDLFYSIITDKFKQTFLRLLRKRVDVLNVLHSNPSQPRPAEAEQSQEELLSFWIANRRETVIILSKAEGSKYQNFANSVIEELTKSVVNEASKTHPQSELNDEYKFVLNRVFYNTIETIVSILSSFKNTENIHSLFKIFWTYHIAGLNALVDEQTPLHQSIT